MEKKEVKVCSNCLGNNIGKVFNEKAYFRSTKGHKPVGLDMCLDCGCYDTCSVKELLDKAREEVQFTRKQLEVLDGLMERIATTSSGEILWPNERTVWGKIDTLLNSKDKNNE